MKIAARKLKSVIHHRMGDSSLPQADRNDGRDKIDIRRVAPVARAVAAVILAKPLL